ncbi:MULTISPECIES: hypothetical protein [unclassified Paenibacillus]|nr:MULTISPECIES: hypothetical protein [unclassified Paenibacillus]MCM3342860.1 hypothetical protein [Paenibacillus sp. MER TA 81-3]
MGELRPDFDTYEDYMKKASTLKTVFIQPSALPEGDSFAKGRIYLGSV